MVVYRSVGKITLERINIICPFFTKQDMSCAAAAVERGHNSSKIKTRKEKVSQLQSREDICEHTDNERRVRLNPSNCSNKNIWCTLSNREKSGHNGGGIVYNSRPNATVLGSIQPGHLSVTQQQSE